VEAASEDCTDFGLCNLNGSRGSTTSGRVVHSACDGNESELKPCQESDLDEERDMVLA
jgi:hypothetical protein